VGERICVGGTEGERYAWSKIEGEDWCRSIVLVSIVPSIFMIKCPLPPFLCCRVNSVLCF
jgi:hypothetical protein